MKNVLAAALWMLAPILCAETVSQPAYRINLDNGWVHRTDNTAPHNDGFGDLIRIYNPNRSGVLSIQSFSAPDSVNPHVLRELTNVAWSEQLDWESWGDFSGYRYSYAEAGAFYRQWWLTDDATILFFVYRSSVEPLQAENNEINQIVRSITANSSN